MQVGKLALASAMLFGSSLLASADPTPQEIGQAMCQRYTTAFNAKDVDAQMALYTGDATLVSPDEGMIVGSEARKKSITEAFKVLSNHHCHCTNAAQIGKDATWAAGTFDLTVADPQKGPQKASGYYTIVLVGAPPNTKIVLETWNFKP